MEVKGIKEAIEFLENFLKNSPYPEDIFTPIPKEDFTKINDLLKKEMGYPIDRLFGNMGRRVYQTIGEDLESIIPPLQQGEKYREMWEGINNLIISKAMNDNADNDILELEQRRYELEQKYFPKEVKQDDVD